MSSTTPLVQSYGDCKRECARHGSTWSGLIAHNTYLCRSLTAYHVVLHRTEVVTFLRSGYIILDSGGWRTVTTKNRINRCLPPGWSLYQEDFDWFVAHDRWGTFDFQDGMTIEPDTGDVSYPPV